jgi:hypothetical protein
LDEQKTDKKPKDKKKKKKKKIDEERDNPSDVQDNNVLTFQIGMLIIGCSVGHDGYWMSY